jgi:hypothetical protein
VSNPYEQADRTTVNDLRDSLARDVAALGDSGIYTILEFTGTGMTVWEISRDQAAIPRCRQRTIAWASANGAQPADLAPAGATRRMLLICAEPADARAVAGWDRMRDARPGALAIACAARVADLLRDVLTHDPLTLPYELVVLRRLTSGRLVLAGQPLFPATARHGYRTVVRLRCEPAGPGGIVFAVVATRRIRHFSLVSVASATVAPGVYDVTAELNCAGQVRFDGLGAELRRDPRPWPELAGSVPRLLPRPDPVHLVVAVEVSGAGDLVAQRLDRIGQLLVSVTNPACVSLISYGPHTHEAVARDVPPRVLSWAGSVDEALAGLERLRLDGPLPLGFSRGVQLECVLDLLADRLNDAYGRPVLVTVGALPACPPRLDTGTEIVPCPHRKSWRAALDVLDAVPGISFGAMRDQGRDEQIWAELGGHALVRVRPGDPVDVQGFATKLEMAGPPADHVPFPILEAEGV